MAEAPRLPNGRIDLDHPRYDQSTFWGRAKHFFTVTDPRNLLHSEAELDRCKTLLQQYRYIDIIINFQSLYITYVNYFTPKGLKCSSRRPFRSFALKICVVSFFVSFYQIGFI